jgi:hypothetical protein
MAEGHIPMTETTAPVGRVSLWAAILGLLLPVLFALVFVLVVSALDETGTRKLTDLRNHELYFALCIVLFVVFELIAFACGLVAIRTGTGKAGLTISGGSLTLATLAVASLVLFVYIDGTVLDSAAAPASSGPPADLAPAGPPELIHRLPEPAEGPEGEPELILELPAPR